MCIRDRHFSLNFCGEFGVIIVERCSERLMISAERAASEAAVYMNPAYGNGWQYIDVVRCLLTGNDCSNLQCRDHRFQYRKSRYIQQVLVGDIIFANEMASKIVDKIDPFQNKALIKSRKQKRSQGSSHYRSPGTSELQALPQLKGMIWENTSLVIES